MIATADMIIKPKDCVLALGFSTNPDQLMSELSACYKDFAKSIKRGAKLNEQALYKKMAEFTALYQSNIHIIRNLGVTVLENCTAVDLRQLPQCKILTLMSHFKPPTILSEDILNADDIEQNIRNRPALFGKFFTGIDSGNNADNLRKVLNDIILDAHFFKKAGLSTFITEHEELKLPEIYIRYLNRIALEKVFPSAIAKGCLVELYDGLFSIKDIISVIPAYFTGIIDLSICHSIIVQDEVKRVEPRRYAFATEEPLRLDFKIIFYKGLMQQLSSVPNDYVSAYFEMIRELKKNL